MPTRKLALYVGHARMGIDMIQVGMTIRDDIFRALRDNNIVFFNAYFALRRSPALGLKVELAFRINDILWPI